MRSELVAEAKEIEPQLDFTRRYWLCKRVVNCILVENYDDRPIQDLGTVTERHIEISAELYQYLLERVAVVDKQDLGDAIESLVAGADLQQAFQSLTSVGSKIDKLLSS